MPRRTTASRSRRTVEGPLSSRQIINSPGAEYTDDELEFLRAVQRLKKRYPFPVWTQIYHLFIGLGYRKVPSDLPPAG